MENAHYNFCLLGGINFPWKQTGSVSNISIMIRRNTRKSMNNQSSESSSFFCLSTLFFISDLCLCFRTLYFYIPDSLERLDLVNHNQLFQKKHTLYRDTKAAFYALCLNPAANVRVLLVYILHGWTFPQSLMPRREQIGYQSWVRGEKVFRHLSPTITHFTVGCSAIIQLLWVPLDVGETVAVTELLDWKIYFELII